MNNANPEHTMRRLLEGDGSVTSTLMRTALYIPGFCYGLAMAARRRGYAAGVLQSFAAGLPTISVGNVTAGGSGKTPTVALLAKRLAEQGHRPGILMRGYMKSADDASDEAVLYSRLVPEAIVCPNPNRRQGAESAKEKGATVLIMDDGFQHQRLRRNLDIVLIDATSPWGGGNTIPGGLLREPKRALRHADAIVVTRADQVGVEKLRQLLSEIGRLNREAFLTTAYHKPVRVQAFDGSTAPLAWLWGRKVAALAGIARPEAFVQTLTSLGAEVVQVFAQSDHHRIEREYVVNAIEQAARRDAIVVTTEKDRAKPVFQDLEREMTDNIYSDEVRGVRSLHVLGVDMAIEDEDALISLVLDAAKADMH